MYTRNIHITSASRCRSSARRPQQQSPTPGKGTRLPVCICNICITTTILNRSSNSLLHVGRMKRLPVCICNIRITTTSRSSNSLPYLERRNGGRCICNMKQSMGICNIRITTTSSRSRSSIRSSRVKLG